MRRHEVPHSTPENLVAIIFARENNDEHNRLPGRIGWVQDVRHSLAFCAALGLWNASRPGFLPTKWHGEHAYHMPLTIERLRKPFCVARIAVFFSPFSSFVGFFFSLVEHGYWCEFHETNPHGIRAEG